MKRRALLLLAGAAVAAAGMPLLGRAAEPSCEAPPEIAQASVRLPHLAAELRAGRPVTIVAIGGGSTAGAAAGGPDLAYPHRLQLVLTAFYPGVPISVINKGQPRQSTQQMVDRFASDVIAEHPVLVVWETGISDAVRGIEIDDFATALHHGIDAIRSHPIDLVLVDMQFSRNATAVIDFDRYLETIHRVGDLDEVYVFPRFELMRYWSEQQMFNFDDVAEADRAALAAKVYDCIGRQLAEAIRRAIQ